MARMGDATHGNVGALIAAGPWDYVGGYDTGSPDIDWTALDWSLFPSSKQIVIDQSNNSTVNTKAHCIVFDVETGAYQPAQAVSLIQQNLTPRPTVYVNQSNLAATIASALLAPNWKGDIWIAIPGWQSGQSLPAIPARCRIVAVQNQLDVNSSYDVSVILDDTWPQLERSNKMMLVKASGPGVYLLSGGKMAPVQDEQSLQAIQASSCPLVTVTDATLTAWLAAFPAGNPAVTVDAAAFPTTLNLNLSGTVTA